MSLPRVTIWALMILFGNLPKNKTKKTAQKWEFWVVFWGVWFFFLGLPHKARPF